MSLWCKLGFHDYQKYREQKEVKCSRCGKNDYRHSFLLLDLEKDAWMKLSKGEWNRKMVDDYIDELWDDE